MIPEKIEIETSNEVRKRTKADFITLDGEQRDKSLLYMILPAIRKKGFEEFKYKTWIWHYPNAIQKVRARVTPLLSEQENRVLWGHVDVENLAYTRINDDLGLIFQYAIENEERDDYEWREEFYSLRKKEFADFDKAVRESESALLDSLNHNVRLSLKDIYLPNGRLREFGCSSCNLHRKHCRGEEGCVFNHITNEDIRGLIKTYKGLLKF